MGRSDNLFTFGNSASDACTMMVIWTTYLRNLCGLCLKDGSHEVICANTRITDSEVLDYRGVQWKKVGHMVSLGQCMACNGSIAEDRKRVGRSWEAAFWRNSKILRCWQITCASRLQFWGSISQGIGSFRYCMWPPSKA